MKKIVFIIKCFAVLLPFLVFSLYAKNNLLYFSDNEVPCYIWNKDFCKTKHTKRYSTVILGDSTANASYIPEVLSSETVNLALGGATPAESYYIFQSYLDNNTAPEDVFISFYDYFLATTNCFWERGQYSHRFTPMQTIEMLKSALNFNEKSVAKDNWFWEYVSYQLYLPNKYVTAVIEFAIDSRYSQNETMYNAVSQNMGRYIGVGEKGSSVNATEYSFFYVAPMFDYYYRKTIDLCLENNCRVHLVKLPLPVNTTFTQSYIDSFNAYYELLSSQYPSITVDWINTGYDTSCFFDNHHMNDKGALQFNLELKKMYPYI